MTWFKFKPRRSETLTQLLRLIPGQHIFGFYRFMPFFFLGGATLEWCMINWRPNGFNFCKYSASLLWIILLISCVNTVMLKKMQYDVCMKSAYFYPKFLLLFIHSYHIHLCQCIQCLHFVCI